MEIVNRYFEYVLDNEVLISRSKIPVFVGVHIRRQDYKEYLDHRFNATIFDEKFFFKAMNFALGLLKTIDNGKNRFCSLSNFALFCHWFAAIIFVVSSDNYVWTKNHIRNNDWNIVYTHDYEKKHGQALDLVDLEFGILSHCNHSIIDYGTFSYLTAYLAGGEVYLPKYYDGTNKSIEITEEIERAGLVGTNKKFHYV